MEDLTYYILGLYVLPMILNILFVYSDKQVKTLEDLMVDWRVYFVPFLNSLFTMSIPIYVIAKYFQSNDVIEKIKKIKIK